MYTLQTVTVGQNGTAMIEHETYIKPFYFYAT